MRSDTPWQAWVHRRWQHERDRLTGALVTAAERIEGEHGLDHPNRPRRLAAKLWGCCRSPELYRDDVSGRLVIQPDACGSRICPRCSRKRSEDLRQAVRLAAMRLDAPAMITLTLRSTDTPLSHQLDRLTEMARRLRRRRAWQQHVAGGLQVIEVTWSQRQQRWHPHLHILCDLWYWPQAQLADEWEAVTGDSRVVDVRRVHSRSAAANYVAKYVAKGADLASIPDHRVPEWAEAVHGRRLAQTFGTLHGQRTTVPKNEADRKLRHLGWLTEMIQAARDGDADARAHLAAITRHGTQWAEGGDIDLADAVEDWLLNRGCRRTVQPRNSRDTGDVPASTGLLPGIPHPVPAGHPDAGVPPA